MDYIELIEEIRAELLQVVNQRCDDMIRMYQSEFGKSIGYGIEIRTIRTTFY